MNQAGSAGSEEVTVVESSMSSESSAPGAASASKQHQVPTVIACTSWNMPLTSGSDWRKTLIVKPLTHAHHSQLPCTNGRRQGLAMDGQVSHHRRQGESHEGHPFEVDPLFLVDVANVAQARFHRSTQPIAIIIERSPIFFHNHGYATSCAVVHPSRRRDRKHHGTEKHVS